MSTFAGDILSVVKPDYTIIEMVYVQQLDQILLINQAKVLIANPYSLVAQKELTIQRSQSLRIVPNTMYAIVTMWYNVINILDISTMKIVKVLSNLNQKYTFNILQLYSEFYTLQNEKSAIYSTRFKMIEKHPTQDIFFINGNNTYVYVVKIKDLPNKQYLYLYDNNIFQNYTLPISGVNQNPITMIYQEPEIDGVKTPMLVIGEKSAYYKLPFIIQGNTISFPTVENKNISISTIENNNQRFYKLEGNNQFVIACQNYASRVELANESIHHYYLDFPNDGYSRRTMYEELEEDYYVFPSSKTIYYSKISDIAGKFQGSRPLFSTQISKIKNSVCRVKLCKECLFLRLSDDTKNFALTTLIYPFDSLSQEINIDSTKKMKWEHINTNLDPFYLNGSTWVVLSFPYEAFIPEDYLCLLFNASTGEKIKLVGDPLDTTWKKISTQFALVSIENLSNQEIIALDMNGQIYVWELLSNQYKFSTQIRNCGSPEIGSIFHYQNRKWLVAACEDFVVRIYDFEYRETTDLTEIILYSMPLALEAFSDPGILVISDFNIGDVHIYKFNLDSQRFSYLITLSKGKFKDTIIGIQLIQSNKTLWIQYQYSNLFFELGPCISNISSCLQCQISAFYNTNETTDNNQIYGLGTELSPFTGSNNYLTVMLKVQMYKDLVAVANKISLNIHVDSTNPMSIKQGLINNDISTFVSVNIIPKDPTSGEIIQLSVSNVLAFQNYLSVFLMNTIINFKRSTPALQCGLQFINTVEKAILEKIVISQDSCYQIIADSTWLQINSLSIENRNFTNLGAIIEMNDSSNLELNNLKIQGVLFGKNSSFVSSNNQLILNLRNASIKECGCPSENIQSNMDLATSVSMFTAGLLYVKELLIENNMFCKKNIFTTRSSLDNSNLNFQFLDIIVRNNIFQMVSQSVFYTSQFYQRVQPKHSVTFQRTTFEKNSILQIENDPSDLRLAHLIMLNKISSIKFEDVKVLNQEGFSLFLSEYSDLIQLKDIVFQNDLDTRDNTSDKQTANCFISKEFKSLDILGLSISYKKANDSPLIYAQNNEATDTKFVIQNSNFSNLILNQNENNLNASPIMIQSPYKIDIILDDITFEDNILNGLKNSLIYSTSAIWITNYVGLIKIQNSTFRRSKSNSLYSYMYIASNNVTISDSLFSEQSFYKIDRSTEVSGGFMSLTTKNVEINDCEFEKSFAEIGAFIMIDAYGSELSIKMSRSSFKEGYALSDGGAIYVNLQSSILIMVCTELVFEDIYTFSDNASVIAFSPQSKDPPRYHNIIFEGGQVKNWLGIGDNQFINLQGMNFTMNNIQDITYNELYSETEAYQYYVEQAYYSQGTLISAKSSIVNIKSCLAQKLDFQVNFSVAALLLSATNSTIALTDFVVKNTSFNRAGIEVINGNLTISRSDFNNIDQDYYVFQENKRTLDIDTTLLTKEPSDVESSFIVLHNSTLITNQGTVFNKIFCYYDCNGSTLQLLNSSFLISDTKMSNSYSAFGGAIYINSMKGDSSIINSEFIFNKAKYTGGAIFLQAEASNEFKLQIKNSQMNGNIAFNGRGGGIFAKQKKLSYESQFLIFDGCQFIQNAAVVGASLDIQGIVPIIDDSTVFRDNIAQLYGNNLLTYASHLKIRNLDEFLLKANATVSSGDEQNSDVDIVINAYQSGSKFPRIEFALVSDSEEEIISISESSQEYIFVEFSEGTSKKHSYSIRGTNTVYFSSTGFSFTDLELIGIPQTSAILEFSSPWIRLLNHESNEYEYSYTFKVQVNFRSCQPGEETKSYSEFTECSTCDKSYFSFDLKACQNCLNGAECLGGAEMITNPGYWRKEVYSEDVLLCLNLEMNCIGGSFGNSICYEGHIGALCEECDIYGEVWDGNFAKSGKYSCVNCSDIKYNYIFVALLTSWTLISMTLAIKGDIEYLEHQAAAGVLFSTRIPRNMSKPTIVNSKSNIQLVSIRDPSSSELKNQVQNEQFNRPISVNSAKEQEDKSGIYIKMLTNYIQIVSSIATFNLSIPSGIIDMPSSVGEPLQQTMNSLDCALKDIQRTIPIIYLRLIFSQIIPCFYMILFVIGLSIKYFFMKNKGKFPTYIISTGFIFLVIYVQPDLVAQTIALISCREIGGTKYILSNVAFECFTDDYGSYTTILVVPLLLVWVLILPGFLYIMLKQNKNNLSNIQVKLRYGFLYREYKQSVFYWEFIKMAEKIAIILALNFYSQSIVTKGILVFIVITVYGVIALIKQPYEEDIINQIDVQSTNICAITVLLGTFIYKNDFDYLVYLGFAVIILINVWYFFSMIKKIASIFLQKFNEPISKFLQLLAKRWKFFEKFIKKVPQKKVKNKAILRKMQLIIRKLIKLDKKEKKELVLKLFLQELDLKYEESEKPNLQKQEEDKIICLGQTEFMSNSERQLQTEIQVQFGGDAISGPSFFPSSPEIEIEDQKNRSQNENKSNQMINETNSQIVIH